MANVMERIAIRAAGDVVTADDVARVVPGDGAAPVPAPSEGWSDVALAEALDGYERTLIARALSAARGNVADAARKLATDRANLYRRMRRLGLEPPRNVAGWPDPRAPRPRHPPPPCSAAPPRAPPTPIN